MTVQSLKESDLEIMTKYDASGVSMIEEDARYPLDTVESLIGFGVREVCDVQQEPALRYHDNSK